MTYGDEAAVPEADELLPRMPMRVGSLYGYVVISIEFECAIKKRTITIPQARAPPIKKSPKRR